MVQLQDYLDQGRSLGSISAAFSNAGFFLEQGLSRIVEPSRSSVFSQSKGLFT